jgi:hypothetical protein
LHLDFRFIPHPFIPSPACFNGQTRGFFSWRGETNHTQRNSLYLRGLPARSRFGEGRGTKGESIFYQRKANKTLSTRL